MPRISARRLIAKARQLFRQSCPTPSARSAVAPVASALRTRLRSTRKPHTAGAFIEGLESRAFLSAAVINQLPAVTAVANSSNQTITTTGLFDDAALVGTVTRFDLNVGSFNVILEDTATPLTVANFLKYVTDGDYVNTIIHRSAKTGDSGVNVIQGGGFRRGLPPTSLPTDAPVLNEPGISNLRGTIAMARSSGVNSATSQWYFNTTDNTALDTNNEGFTVFGHVLGTGMTVVDAIAALPRVNAGGALTTLPLTNYTSGTVQLSNFVNVNSITTISKISISSASSSNPNLVTASLDANQNLVLHYVPRQTGSATITLNALSADGSTASQTFNVTVNPDPAQVAPVTMSTSAIKTVNYTEPDGTVVTLKFTSPNPSSSTATLDFYGSGVSVNTSNGVTTLTGGVQLVSIAFSGAETAKTLFTVTTKGGTDAGIATVESITGDHGLGTFTAPNLDVIGPGVVFTGGGFINNLTLHDLKNGADIIMPGGQPFIPYVGLTLNIDSTSDGSDITLAQKMKSITANHLGNGTIRTAFIGSLTVTADPKADASRGLDGNMAASLTLTGDGAPVKGGALASAKVGGSASGTWNVIGAGGKINVGSTTSTFNALFSSAVDLFATTTGDFSGSFTATQVKAVTVKSNMLNAKLILSGAFSADPKIKALGKLTVGGNVSGSVVTGAGSFGAITAKTFTNSFIYSGVASVDPANPPTSVNSIANPTSITSLTVTSTAANAFSGTHIAASQLGKINLKKIDTASASHFHMVADKIASLAGIDGAGKSFKLTKLDDEAALEAKIANLTLGEFEIHLL